MNTLLELDRDATLALNSMYSETLDPFFFYLSNSKYVWFGLGALLIFFIFRKVHPNYRKALIFMIFMAVMILFCDQICNIFKHGVERFRPCWEPEIMDQVHIVNNDRGGKYGFFSAHSAIFFGIALITSKYFQKNWYTVLIYSIAVLFAYSRIYLGRHYIGDVVCGALEGSLIAWLSYYFYQKFLDKYNKKHPHKRTINKK